MKKRIFSLAMAILMLLTCVLSFASCMGGGGGGDTTTEACEHTDEKDHDGKCDKCKEVMAKAPCLDANHDGKCDVAACKTKAVEIKHDYDGYRCKSETCVDPIKPHDHVDDGNGTCTLCGGDSCDHVDGDADAFCDLCEKPLDRPRCSGQCIDAYGDGKCDECYYTIKCTHIDAGGDGKCDYCQCPMGADGGAEDDVEYPWGDAQQIIKIQLSKNSNNQEIVPVADAYLAGDNSYTNSVAKAARARNSAATAKTGVKPTYDYYSDNKDYNWGAVMNKIATATSQNGGPDVYSVFIYDMVGASLKRCFANLLQTAKRPNNYFEFNDEDYNPEDTVKGDRGYMYEYMESLTLAPGKKMYVLSSDYFIDMVRSFFCIPVSIKLMEEKGIDALSLGEDGTVYDGGDRNGDGEFDMQDFYDLVIDGEWTYDFLARISKDAWKASGTSSSGASLSDESIGFAISTGGLAASGLLYTSSVEIISKKADGNGGYIYEYPSSNDAFYKFADAANKLFSDTSNGCVVVNKDNFGSYGSNTYLAIRNRFVQNAVLFGDIVVLGALEYAEYQDMADDGGFGVVPVPVYKAGDKYLTQVHNVGSCGAIAQNTDYFAQCTAFLNYQSTNSSIVLNDYYTYEIVYGLSPVNSQGTMAMLEYLRANVRSSFDKAMEDAIAVNSEGTVTRWHGVLANANYQIDVRTKYESSYNEKQGALNKLVETMNNLPD